MQFGEVVEPSTRALTEDDYEELPEYSEFLFEWTGSEEPPADLDNLIILESKKVLRIYKKCLTDTSTIICESKKCGVKIYRVVLEKKIEGKVKYILTFEDRFQRDFSYGQIIEELSQWFNQAQQIITITSAPLASYQTDELPNSFETFIRVLSTNEALKFSHKRLESPNIMSGLGAGVLSYCIHTGKHCSSFIAYMDASPIDSVNSKPLLELAVQFELLPELPHMTPDDLPSNNLYM